MERTDKQENMCGGENRQEFSAACQSGFLHRARVEVFAQSVEFVGTKELREFVKLLRVVNTQRGAVCRELNQGVEVLPLSELLLRLVIHISVEPAPDISLDDVFCVLVVGTHAG